MKKNNQLLTKEFCKTAGILQFFPRTTDEAGFIQDQFSKMGFEYYSKTPPVSKCIDLGMFLFTDKLIWIGHYDPSLLCDISQFEEKYISDRDFMLEQFNRLAARFDALEARMLGIEQEFQPKRLDKSVFEKEKSGFDVTFNGGG